MLYNNNIFLVNIFLRLKVTSKYVLYYLSYELLRKKNV